MFLLLYETSMQNDCYPNHAFWCKNFYTYTSFSSDNTNIWFSIVFQSPQNSRNLTNFLLFLEKYT